VCRSSDGNVNVWEKEATADRFVHAGYHKGHRLAFICRGRVVISSYDDATTHVLRCDHDNKASGHTCLAMIEGHCRPMRCLVDTARMREEWWCTSSGINKGTCYRRNSHALDFRANIGGSMHD
jgi:hypothetical protein